MAPGSPKKGKGKGAADKQEKKKQAKRRDTLEQEFRRRVAEKMAEGIRNMMTEEERATNLIQREKAKLELETAEEKKARKRRRREERRAARRAAEAQSSLPPLRPATSPAGKRERQVFLRVDPIKSNRSSRFGSRAKMSMSAFTDQIQVFEYSQMFFGLFTGRRKKQLITTLSGQLHDPHLSIKKRRVVAAMMIQRAVQNIILDPIRRERAARVIQKNFKIYKEYIMREKWMIMIKLEKKTRTENERKAHDSRLKRERHKVMVAAEEKKRMERQAMRAGAWNPQEMKNKQKGWSKKEEAILVALNYAHGLPTDEDGWELYCEEFPRRKKIEVVKIVSKMKVTGAIHDLELFDELSPEELQRIVGV